MKFLVFVIYCKCFNVVNEIKEFGDIYLFWNKKWLLLIYIVYWILIVDYGIIKIWNG